MRGNKPSDPPAIEELKDAWTAGLARTEELFTTEELWSEPRWRWPFDNLGDDAA